ncbi:hypothetical protein LSAT2_032405 [Lamellibrachia satsuma]|nr:hypothetical protein LSAT2_032405 [Lamellibrachia satsuma]
MSTIVYESCRKEHHRIRVVSERAPPYTSRVVKSTIVYESCWKEHHRIRVVSERAPSYTSRVGKSTIVYESCRKEHHRIRVVSAGAASYTRSPFEPRIVLSSLITKPAHLRSRNRSNVHAMRGDTWTGSMKHRIVRGPFQFTWRRAEMPTASQVISDFKRCRRVSVNTAQHSDYAKDSYDGQLLLGELIWRYGDLVVSGFLDTVIMSLLDSVKRRPSRQSMTPRRVLLSKYSGRYQWLRDDRFLKDLEGDSVDTEILDEELRSLDEQQPKNCRDKTLKFLESNPFQIALCLLVLADAGIVICEILMDLHATRAVVTTIVWCFEISFN